MNQAIPLHATDLLMGAVLVLLAAGAVVVILRRRK